MDRDIDEVEFTIFDTETTGLEPEAGDRIVEIAGVRLRGNHRIAVFQSLANPHRSISEAAFTVNRISPQMLEGAPEMRILIPKFLDFIRGSCLCSYNAAFDLGFLKYELALDGRQFPQEIIVVDILRMARRLLPGLERYALCYVAERLGIKVQQQHRALSDVELTRDVFYRLKEKLRSKGVLDFGNFSGLFGISSPLVDSLNYQKLTKIQEAIGLGVKLKIRYISSSQSEVSEREVIPKEVRQEQGIHYLVGYCCLRKQERTFRIDNVLGLEIL